jgi:hypothetical protein
MASTRVHLSRSSTRWNFSPGEEFRFDSVGQPIPSIHAGDGDYSIYHAEVSTPTAWGPDDFNDEASV